MSPNEDSDPEGRSDEEHCTVCGAGSFRGRRGLSSHLARSLQCSASSEVQVLGDDEGAPPAVGRLTCSVALGGRNNDLTKQHGVLGHGALIF